MKNSSSKAEPNFTFKKREKEVENIIQHNKNRIN